jgi:hypothetical protein
MVIATWVHRCARTTAIAALVVGVVAGCAPAATPRYVSVGSWEFTARRDVVTQQDTSLAIAWAFLHPRGAAASGLAIHCDARFLHGIGIYLAADTYIGSEAAYPVTLQFGNAPTVTLPWQTAASGRAVYLPDEHQQMFLEQLQQNPRISLRVTAGPGTIAYVVDATGLAAMLDALTCYSGPRR